MAVDQSSPTIGNKTDGWKSGPVKHIIPTANHERFLIKISLEAPVPESPRLRAGDKVVGGSRTDVAGRCFQFDVSGLQPSTEYALQLFDSENGKLSDPWPLKTHPAPDAEVDHLRILTYTCGGGYDGPAFEGKTIWNDMAARRRLLRRGMGFQPDVVISNGDQIYWDLRTLADFPPALEAHMKQHWWGRFGTFDRSMPANYGDNDKVLQAICDYQIAGLYGCDLRSTPSYFQTDDHDMFENDNFDAHLATLPPGEFGQTGEDLTQLRSYPEFLPTPGRPPYLWGSTAPGRALDVNQFFGGLRYGRLLEILMYDCRRFADYKGIHARVVPRWTENWLKSKTVNEDTHHLMHSPSLPFGYSSGKLGDWYPDAIGFDGKLALDRPKEAWQSGWHAQCQRITEMLAAQKKRRAVIIQGDYHASALGKMTRSSQLSLSSNPVEVVLVGTLGSGDIAFPSSFRKVENSPSLTVEMDQALPISEKNGFTIIDVTPEKLSFRLFTWRPPQPVEQIDTMDPVITYEVKGRGMPKASAA